MKKQLYATLVECIDTWMNEHCEEDMWPKMYVGEKTGELMAKAAASVFDAVHEFQNYAEKEGFIEVL